MKTKAYSWVPTLYLGEALPFSAVMLISLIMFQELGLTVWFRVLSEFNEKLLTKYGIEPTFKNYTPHLTLAEIQPGLTQKYVDLDQLRLILEASTVRPEDLIISYDAGDKDYKVHNITYNNTVDRFFRIRDLKREAQEIYRGE